MTESVVKVSMIEDNGLNCSYAIISKDKLNIIIIFKDLECAIFDLDDLKETKEYRYLLLKHYVTGSYAYTDFLKLIGKMCKKDKSSKYFMNHKKEDNRMVVHKDGERMISEEERVLFENRYNIFKESVLTNRHLF